MSNLRILSALTLLALVTGACKKTSTDVPPAASLTVVHAAIGYSPVKVNYTDVPIVYKTYTDSITYGSGKEYGIPASNAPLSIVASADTNTALLNSRFSLGAGGYYSLFLAGQAGKGVDTLLLKDNFRNYGISDSLIGVRFVNLSPDAGNVSAILSGNTAPDVINLGYKQASSFISYPAKSATTSLVFQVKDAGGTVLGSYTISATSTPKLIAARFHNITIVLRGLKAGSGSAAPGLFAVQHF